MLEMFTAKRRVSVKSGQEACLTCFVCLHNELLSGSSLNTADDLYRSKVSQINETVRGDS